MTGCRYRVVGGRLSRLHVPEDKRRVCRSRGGRRFWCVSGHEVRERGSGKETRG